MNGSTTPYQNGPHRAWVGQGINMSRRKRYLNFRGSQSQSASDVREEVCVSLTGGERGRSRSRTRELWASGAQQNSAAVSFSCSAENLEAPYVVGSRSSERGLW
jgi:hypothetical protein